MSDYAASVRPSRCEDATYMASSLANQSRWMSRWINGSPKQGPLLDNSSLISYQGENFYSRGNSDEKIQDLSMKPGVFEKKLGKASLSAIILGKNKEKISVNSPEKKNFQSFFLKQHSQNVSCSFRNVETMRICTMENSMNNSLGDPPNTPRRAHHISFMKETCVNMSKAHPEENSFSGSFSMSRGVDCRSKGVKIQPLWTSTDSEEKEYAGDPSICKTSSRIEAPPETNKLRAELDVTHRKEKKLGESFRLYSNVSSYAKGVKIQPLWGFTDGEEEGHAGNRTICKEGSRHAVSAETYGMRVKALKDQHKLLGMESSSLAKYDTMDNNNPPTGCDSSTMKAGSKRPMNEISDTNEKLPRLQPAVSSTVGNSPSTLRVHSLNAKQCFSCNEHTSRPDCSVRPDHFSVDASTRWIKRLKLNSSDSCGVGTKKSDTITESPSHDKLSMFFNRIMKGNRGSYDAKLQNPIGNVQMVIDQNVKSLKSGVPLSKDSKKSKGIKMLGCYWIQRWRQSPSPINRKPVMIREPHSLKSGHEKLAKKQFPSIAAMALVGKAMNGFPSCEIKRRGPVVVWNTKGL